MASAVTTPHPTLSNITVEWAIQGDDNLNSTVRVRYRKKGKLSWTLGMPLRRIPAGTLEGFSWTNRHSGSVFDVDPGTTYEVELWLRDPDGGCRIETVTVKTRPLPIPMANAPITKVTPSTLTASLAASKAGDILDLGASTYPGFVVPKDGTPGKPIVIRSTQSAKVQGTIDVRHREYVHIVGFTAPRIRFGLSKHVSIMKNTISLVGTFDGIGAWKRAEDAYIADNTVAGTTTWIEAAMGAHGQNSGEGILVTGPGHVITHNKVTGCRDNISFLEGKGEAFDQYSIDVIENDIDVATDDGVEADFCAHNCRIMRNRFTNVFIAMSSQPGLGGPTYFIRNVVYNNVFNAVFKLNRGSIGDVALHNTVVKGGDALAGTPGQTHYRQYFRNNLFLGGKGGTYNGWSSGDGKIVYMPFAAIDGSYDYDGFGSQAGNYGGKIGSVSFANMNELRSKTTEKHATKVDLSIFAKTISLPNPPFPQKSVPDLRLKAGAGAIDKGVVIPGINGNYAGAAPDLGAYEAGKALPAYGPRP
ncbi:MAG: right-handed parallel beta-helix repeat-containing protein [Deltaproteobacteria bacterium]|nr:right-handed parallel beta-helix repeat-containing protein [Deltaproteobacteria bacterium]